MSSPNDNTSPHARAYYDNHTARRRQLSSGPLEHTNWLKCMSNTMTTKNQIDSFGYLLKTLNFSFDGGLVRTKEDSVKPRKWINSKTNKDGYLYPPTSYDATSNTSAKGWRRVSKTSRPKKYFFVPPSHDIILLNPSDQKSDRHGLAGFVVQSLAFLFGTKLQFWDWFIEGRVPIKTRTIAVSTFPSDVRMFFERAVPTWQSFNDLNKKRIVNLLFVHSIAGALEWDWQQFLLEYMVTDACYKIAHNLGECKSVPHKYRLRSLSDSFGLVRDDHWFDLIVCLRNNLFHETLWDGGRPFDYRSLETLYAPINLRRFNHRLVTALLCGPGRYTKTKWTSNLQYAYFI